MSAYSELPSGARAAIKAQLDRLKVSPVVLSAGKGVASLDTSGGVPMVTYVAVGDDGTVTTRRAPVPADAVPRGRTIDGRDAVQAAADYAEANGPDDPRAEVRFSEALDWFGLRGRAATIGDAFASAFEVSNPDVPVPRDLLSGVMAEVTRERGAVDVAAALDPEAVHALRAVRDFSRAAYAYYAARNSFRTDRHQAAQAYPLLAAAMAEKVSTKIAIDRRKPLADALEASMGADAAGRPRLSRAVQKRLNKVDWFDEGVPMEVVVNALGSLPPDWFPKDERNWKAFLDVADTLFRHLPDLTGESPVTLATGCGGKWAEFRRRVAKAATPTMPPEDLPDEEKARWRPVVDESRDALMGAATGVMDMVHHFRDFVLLPVCTSASDRPAYLSEAIRRSADEASGRLLFQGRSLPAILEQAIAWHTRVAAINVAVIGEDEVRKDRERKERITKGQLRPVPEGGWAPLCPIVTAPNGVTVVPLLHESELGDEGQSGLNQDGTTGLSHCVGGYASSCKNGGHHILSFRIYDGESFQRLSTAEFGKLKDDSNRLQLCQNKAKGNGRPSAVAQAAYDWFVKEVETGCIPINRDGIMTVMSQWRRPDDEIEALAGYDRKDPKLVAMALEAWGPVAGARLKGLDVDAVRDMPELEGLVEALVPSYRPTMG